MSNQKQIDKNQQPRLRHPLTLMFLLLFCIMTAGMISNYITLRQTVLDQSTTNLKQQRQTELDIYQRGYASAINTYFGNALNTVESLASNPDVLRDIKSNQLSDLTTVFLHQRAYDQQFNTLVAFGNDGRLLAISTDAKNANPNITVSLLNPVLQKAASLHNPVITSAYISSVGRYVIAFVAPVSDTNGNTVGFVSGMSSLQDLTKRISFLTSYSNFGSIIADSAGNVLINDNQPVTKLINISKTDPIISQLNDSNSSKPIHETNFAGQPSLAEGVKLSFEHAGNVYAISYLYDKGLHSYVNDLQGTVTGLASHFIVLNIVFLVLVVAILIRLSYINQPPK